ncbi:MAG: poly(R)-hydroxyalkanoic acid synthase subunit PhaE [Dehalococcoidia bacterium]
MSNQTPPPADPFGAWRQWLDQSERRWNEFFNEAMGTDQYSQVMGQMTRGYVAMQQQMGEMVERYLKSINVPTRSDLQEISERLSAIESRLISIEGRLPTPAQERAPARAAAPRPPRTRKPPSARSGGAS